jgi:hypothetical protein
MIVMAQFCPVRRALALLLAVLFVATAMSVVAGSPADAALSVDKRLSQGQCALTGRVWVAGRGCARHYCVSGATMFKEGHDAELCMLRGRNGAEFARPINSRRCADLGRVWIGEINSCASNPNRARLVISNAPQCRGAGKVYVNHREEEGRYDECLTPGRIAKLRKIAKRQGDSLNEAALNRNRFNCSYRAGWVMQQGTCVKREGPLPGSQQGGFLMVGDSVSWRADDELYAREHQWILDLRPGRRLDELPGRLSWFRANHGNPDQLIVQLGTNRRQGFNEGDFRDTMASLPASTPVLFLLPYRKFQGDNSGPVAATKKYGQWMRELAADRPLTCLSEWPKIAASHLSYLVDGEHPDSHHEGWYARYVVRAWGDCAKHLGL